MGNLVFRRKEQKYLLDDRQRRAFIEQMEAHMQPDKYPRSSIRNIYYDTPDYRLIRRSLEKPVYKEKLRLRCYGSPEAGGDVFLEMKKKYKGVVYKRRVAMTAEAAEAYMADPAARLEAGQIGREIDYFKQFYGQLQNGSAGRVSTATCASLWTGMSATAPMTCACRHRRGDGRFWNPARRWWRSSQPPRCRCGWWRS